MKKCKVCGVYQELTEYHRDRTYRDKHTSTCKTCTNVKKRAGMERLRRMHSYLYKVAYDPWDSFTENSAFTLNEIKDLADNGFLAIGTRFERGRIKVVIANDGKVLTKNLE